MMATTIPASDSPSRSAALIDTKATASTPIRPAMTSRMIEAASAMTTGTVAAAQMVWARVPSASDTPSPTTRPDSAIRMRP